MPSLPIIKPMLVSCAACVLQAMAFGAVGGWFLDQWGIYLYNLRVCIVYHQFLHWIGDLGVHIQLYIYIILYIYISHYTPCAEQIQYANFRANVAWMGWDSNGIMMNSPISQCQGPGVGNGKYCCHRWRPGVSWVAEKTCRITCEASGDRRIPRYVFLDLNKSDGFCVIDVI